MVINVACVQHSILPTDAFFTLILKAIVLNLLVPVTINWWRAHYLQATAGAAHEARQFLQPRAAGLRVRAG